MCLIYSLLLVYKRHLMSWIWAPWRANLSSVGRCPQRSLQSIKLSSFQNGRRPNSFYQIVVVPSMPEHLKKNSQCGGLAQTFPYDCSTYSPIKQSIHFAIASFCLRISLQFAESLYLLWIAVVGPKSLRHAPPSSIGSVSLLHATLFHMNE